MQCAVYVENDVHSVYTIYTYFYTVILTLTYKVLEKIYQNMKNI